MPAKLTAEIDATTITCKPVRLPVGAESFLSEDEVRAQMESHPGQALELCVSIRCPGAENFAPYHIDAADLLFALESE